MSLPVTISSFIVYSVGIKKLDRRESVVVVVIYCTCVCRYFGGQSLSLQCSRMSALLSAAPRRHGAGPG